MFVTKSVSCARWLAAVLSLAVAGQAFAAPQKPHKPALKQPGPAGEEIAAAPAPTLAQMPAAPPQVTFQNGMLTIVSKNSTLGDILRAVHSRTGAAVDVPPNATERVVANLGPGPARDILAALLNGSHFNYVMLGSATEPHALDRVILTAKTSTGSAPTEAAVKPPQPNQAAADDDDEDAADADDEEADTEDTEAEDASATSGDESQPQQVQPVGGAQGQPNVRTPEQILQQLRQQQLQQQQGQQPGAPPGGAPQPFPNQPDPTPPN